MTNQDLPHFNEKEFRNRIEDDEEFFEDLLTKVKNTIDDDFNALHESFKTKEISKITKAAHKIKGTAVTVCFEKLSALTIELESKTEFIESTIQNLIDEIGLEIKHLKTLIPF